MSADRFPYVLVHYNEIALKGRNRGMFEKRLRDNIRRAVRGLGVEQVKRLPGRILMRLDEDADRPTILERLGTVFGIASYSPAYQVSGDIDAITAHILKRIAGREIGTFGVKARRADKSFHLSSQRINEHVGAAIVQATGAKVNLTDPDTWVRIEILSGRAIYSFERQPGAQGLPVGVSGKVAAMLSGGIDSPVAAARMMRRGCRVVCVHFHSAPYTSADSQEKVRDLAQRLTRYQDSIRLYNVPFLDVQKAIVTGTHPPYRVLLYRRFMVRIAELIARSDGAQALVTGESLAQVASQTLENLAAVGAVAGLPMLRPLVGLDKQEIIAEAERIGTFEISIRPHDDCCSYLMPDHPATRSNAEMLSAAEEALDVEPLVRSAYEKTGRVELRHGGG